MIDRYVFGFRSGGRDDRRHPLRLQERADRSDRHQRSPRRGGAVAGIDRRRAGKAALRRRLDTLRADMGGGAGNAGLPGLGKRIGGSFAALAAAARLALASRP